MTREREKSSQVFVPAAGIDDLVSSARMNGGFINGVEKVSSLRPDFLKRWFEDVFDKTVRVNGDWAEAKFEDLRRDKGDWSLDGMWVDEKGEVVGNAFWSTYRAFSNNYTLMFSLDDLARSIKEREKMVYPLAPKRDTVLFWQVQDERVVLPIIETVFDRSSFEEYPSAIGTDDVRMCRIRTGKLGPVAFASEGVILGKIGFWESRRLSMGNYGFGIYVQRVAFRDSLLLPKGAYVSPLDPQIVKARGGNIMEEKYPDVPIARVDPKLAEQDFIAAVFAGGRPIEDLPMVLSYTTPKIWLGEGPKHGSGKI